MTWIDAVFGRPILQVVAHAARASRSVNLAVERPLSRFVTIKSSDGQKIDADQSFVVIASGDSLVSKGISRGDKLLARKIVIDDIKRIARGAVLVVNGPAEYSNTGRRLRVFSHAQDKMVYFSPEDGSSQFKGRPLDQIEGVVTHKIS